MRQEATYSSESDKKKLADEFLNGNSSRFEKCKSITLYVYIFLKPIRYKS